MKNSKLPANPNINRPLKEGFTQEENEQQKLNQKHHRHCCGDEVRWIIPPIDSTKAISAMMHGILTVTSGEE